MLLGLGDRVRFLIVCDGLYVGVDEFVVRVYELLGDGVVYVGMCNVVNELGRYVYMVYCSSLFVAPSGYIWCVGVKVWDDGCVCGRGVV